MRHVLMLWNPISGTTNRTGKQDLASLAKRFCEERNWQFSAHQTRKEGDYQDLYSEVETNQVTDLLIAGGDGTVNQVIQAFRRFEHLRFGIIPLGSGNGLAYSAGIPSAPAEALLLLEQGNIAPTDLFEVNGKTACMLSGVGFDAAVAHGFAQQKTRGLLTYTTETVRQLAQAQPHPFSFNTQHHSFSTEAFFISVANSNQFGNQFTIAPYASLHDGLLDVVVVRKMSKLLLPFTILKQVTGQNKPIEIIEHVEQEPVFQQSNRSDSLSGKSTKEAFSKQAGIWYFQTNQLLISNPSRALLHIDGDPVETSESLQFTLLPKAYSLWCGPA